MPSSKDDNFADDGGFVADNGLTPSGVLLAMNAFEYLNEYVIVAIRGVSAFPKSFTLDRFPSQTHPTKTHSLLPSSNKLKKNQPWVRPLLPLSGRPGTLCTEY